MNCKFWTGGIMGLTTRTLTGWAYQSPEAITGLTKILEGENHPTQTKEDLQQWLLQQ
jgi:hypothetical protein